MALQKLILDDDLDVTFDLIAIHCSVEEYMMAYLLNRNLGLRFRRKEEDLDFIRDGKTITYAMYEFEDVKKHIQYYLIANTSNPLQSKSEKNNDQFTSLFSEKENTYYLIPELKKVDFFLKIDSDYETLPIREMLSKINNIKQIISAYSVDITNLKSKNNLIFD